MAPERKVHLGEIVLAVEGDGCVRAQDSGQGPFGRLGEGHRLRQPPSMEDDMCQEALGLERHDALGAESAT